MKTRLTVLSVGSVVEEELWVRVGAHELLCFLNVCVGRVVPGCSYEGEFSLWASRDLELHAAGAEMVGLTRFGDGFGYRVVGFLRGTVLDAGVQFEDDLFVSEFGYLDGSEVAVVVDRINLAIL